MDLIGLATSNLTYVLGAVKSYLPTVMTNPMHAGIAAFVISLIYFAVQFLYQLVPTSIVISALIGIVVFFVQSTRDGDDKNSQVKQNESSEDKSQ